VTATACRSESARFYDMTARWWGDPGIRDSDRALAARLDRAAGGTPVEVLELGAGFGGAAAATAQLGHRVVAIEASGTRAAMARRRTLGGARGRLTVVEADFCEAAVPGPFDVVAYWNGFGVGTGEDQRKLLGRIRGWLRASGLALMHAYDPKWWREHAGARRRRDGMVQEIGYEPEHRCLVDRWWPDGHPGEAVRERIRCYAEAELRTLLDEAGLALAGTERDDATPWKYLVELRPI
jgi:SAM-dependent methyltransferase